MWWLLNMIAYNSYSLGGFPLVVLIGFAALALLLVAGLLAILRRRTKALRGMPGAVPWWIAFTGVILALIHFVMALTNYVGTT